MNQERKINILLLSKNEELKKYLEGLLEGEGFDVFFSDEKSFFDKVREKKINIILLDFETTPVIDICKEFRKKFTFYSTPVIVLINKECTIEKIKSVYAGADDYVEKPISSGELLTRIKASIWRIERSLDANSLTKLPGNNSILKEIARRLEAEERFAVGYADLDNFKEYNDYYGFSWGDKVIKFTAQIISDTVIKLAPENSFVGHIGGDDFVFILSPSKMEEVCKEIIRRFDEGIVSFYKEKDLKREYILVKNREGKVTSIPIMAISIGVTSTESRKFRHLGEIIQIITELKNYAKIFPQSNYIIDRRRE